MKTHISFTHTFKCIFFAQNDKNMDFGLHHLHWKLIWRGSLKYPVWTGIIIIIIIYFFFPVFLPTLSSQLTLNSSNHPPIYSGRGAIAPPPPGGRKEADAPSPRRIPSSPMPLLQGVQGASYDATLSPSPPPSLGVAAQLKPLPRVPAILGLGRTQDRTRLLGVSVLNGSPRFYCCTTAAPEQEWLQGGKPLSLFIRTLTVVLRQTYPLSFTVT